MFRARVRSRSGFASTNRSRGGCHAADSQSLTVGVQVVFMLLGDLENGGPGERWQRAWSDPVSTRPDPAGVPASSLRRSFMRAAQASRPAQVPG